MIVECVWEHNNHDSLLHAVHFPGAYTRGESLDIAKMKMISEIQSYLAWRGQVVLDSISVEVVQDAPCELQIKDADSDVIFYSERNPLELDEYIVLRDLALKSAVDFQRLYDSIPDKNFRTGPGRTTFYGKVPKTAWEMYDHTRSVNSYYFAEIDLEVDNSGSILECRSQGFDKLENTPNFLLKSVQEGSYGEMWSVRKVLRRFIWHDRIHAKAMYRMAVKVFGKENIANPFCFTE